MKRTFIVVAIAFITLIACSQEDSKKEQSPSKPKNIILMIGDGMGVSQIYAGMTANKGKLNLEQFKDIGFSKTHSSSDYITDSGAGGTAISTGYKTYNHAIGVDKDTIPRTTILEHAEKHGKATGLVATSQVTHATPASFIAHQKKRYMYEEIALDFLNTDIEVFIGGGLDHFNARKDKRDLTKELSENGYTMIYDIKDFEGLSNTCKVGGLLYKDAPPRFSDGRNDMLLKSTNTAISVLDQYEKGFFLMIEASQIDWGPMTTTQNLLWKKCLISTKQLVKSWNLPKKTETPW